MNAQRTVVGRMVDRVKSEPVATQGLVQATLAALLGFGVISWTSEQTGLTLALTAAILTFLTRSQVRPAGKGVEDKAAAEPPARVDNAA
ncbi:MAG TPA: hypothetical protein VFV67_32275 [Actinophytocola sp.]|uniref:hypothetical protein n=1 Tax=Actinophytocola sp. TaxID=1872138 RepID=UPI002DB6C764|nr:hypothetical protein [Actinophytocola sp.]HEU5475344.1 hypothetical protein [Actinophytocola sp.]